MEPDHDEASEASSQRLQKGAHRAGAFRKKLKLKKTTQLKGDESVRDDSVQDQLLANVVKIDGQWQYVNDVEQPAQSGAASRFPRAGESTARIPRRASRGSCETPRRASRDSLQDS